MNIRMLVIIGLASYATAAIAQSTSSATSGGVPSADTGQIEEIVVTAQKHSEDINKVPMTITAVSGEELASLGITDTKELNKLTPGFTFADTSIGIPVYTLRGVGFYDESLSSTPAVSVYQDEIPLTYPSQARGTILDLERVEILKGPQGTLFGQNSTGGAVNYVAAKPTDHLTYGSDLTFARFAEIDADGFISGPISDTIRMRAAFSTTQRLDGWQQSETRNDTLGKANKTLGRVLLDWTPDDVLSLRFNVNGWIDRSQTQAAQFISILPQHANNIPPALLTFPPAQPNDRSADWEDTLDGYPHRDEQFLQTSVRADAKLTNTIMLTSLSSYSHLEGTSSFDSDGLPYQAYDFINHERILNYFQELRVAGNEDRVNWVVGGNYEHDQTYQSTPFYVGFSSDSPTDGFPITAAGILANTTSATSAVFGNLEYKLLDNVALQGGARFTKSDQAGEGCGYTQTAALDDLFDLLSNVISGGLSSPHLAVGDCYTLGPAPTFLPTLASNRLDENNTSWRTSLNWNATTDLLLYGSVSKGFKSGGFPALGATSTVSEEPYRQEELLAYEVGYKATLADRRVQFDGAAFYYDYSDKQILGNYLDPIFGILPRIVNIPKSQIEGFESSVEIRPIIGLRLAVAGAYLDSKIDSFTGYNTLAQLGNQSGTALPFTPKFTANGDVEYEWPAFANTKAFVGGGLTYNSSTNAGVGAPPQLAIDSYALLDLRAGLRSKDGHWTVTAFGRNVTDKYYWNTVIHIQDGIVRYTGFPATFGVTLSYRH